MRTSLLSMKLAGQLSLSLVASLAIGSTARAGLLPPVTQPLPAMALTELYTVYNTDTVPTTTYSSTGTALTGTVSNSVPGTYTAVTTNASTASVSVIASSMAPSSSGASTATSSGRLTYFYVVANAIGPVPLDISYFLTASRTPTLPIDFSTPAATAAIYFYQDLNDAGLVLDSAPFVEAGAGYGNSNTLSATYATEFLPGDESYGRIDLQVKASSLGYASSPDFSSYSTALADPYLYIPQAYLDAHPGVTLEISAGIGNVNPMSAPVSPVPEPASWMLLIAGAGGAGLMLRRSRGMAVAPRDFSVAT